MEILVTGGAGFIGSHYVDLMTVNSDISKIYVLDRFTYAGNTKNLKQSMLSGKVELIVDDICNVSNFEDKLAGIDTIVNFAAESHVDNSIKDSSVFVHSNIVGVQKLLEFAVIANVKKFVQISTDEVYGTIANGSWDETQPLKPNSPYAATKAAADLLVLAYANTHGLNVNITRTCNNFGERQFPEKLIPLSINRILKEEYIPIYGDGSNTREWIYVKDNCVAIENIMRKGKPSQIYNIGSGKELTNLNLIESIMSILKCNKNLINFVPDRKGHDKRYSVNSKKFRDDFGITFGTNFEINLESTINWYKNNQEWFMP